MQAAWYTLNNTQEEALRFKKVGNPRFCPVVVRCDFSRQANLDKKYKGPKESMLDLATVRRYCA